MKFLYNINNQLPALAWLATISKNDATIEVSCGEAVVTTDEWFAAGVWNGDLQKGEIDTCSTCCCTGMKLNSKLGGGKLITPNHLQETVFSIEVDGKLYVSNSMTFALVASGSSLIKNYKAYVADMGSILYGLESNKLVKQSPLCNGRTLRYIRCCIAEIDINLQIKEKTRHSGLNFSDFADYKQKVIDILAAIKSNASDIARKMPYGMISTISRGYDAPSVCALAKCVGCDEVFTFVDNAADDGTEIANILGYSNIHRVNSKEYKSNEKFLEAEAFASGETDPVFINFEDLYRNKLLLLGERGDSVYERLHCNANNNYDFHVGNQLSQASQTIFENMLKNNSVVIAVPLIGGDRWTDLARISKSEEMQTFSIGEHYDRPIARRLLEEASVKREMFGQNKYGGGISLSLDTFGRMCSKMSTKSFAALKVYKNKFPKHWWNDLCYQTKYFWINRSIYLNYICSKLHLKQVLKGKGDNVGMLANPNSTMMLCWGVEMMKKRYENFKQQSI